MLATYRATPDSEPVLCEVISRARGEVVLREVDRPLPGIWTARLDQVVRYKPHGWTDQRLGALRRDYENTALTLYQLGKLHRTSSGRVALLARKHGWTRHPDRRGRIGRIPGPQGVHQEGAQA